MYLIATRSFPPEVGGMQSLMWGLVKEMSKNFMIKVFADYQENHREFDKNENVRKIQVWFKTFVFSSCEIDP